MTVFTQSSYSGPLQFTGHPYHHHLPQHLGEAGSLPSRRTSGLEGANASYPPKGIGSFVAISGGCQSRDPAHYKPYVKRFLKSCPRQNSDPATLTALSCQGPWLVSRCSASAR